DTDFHGPDLSHGPVAARKNLPDRIERRLVPAARRIRLEIKPKNVEAIPETVEQHLRRETVRSRHAPEAAIAFEDGARTEKTRVGEKSRVDSRHCRPRHHVLRPRERAIAPVPLRGARER